MSWGDDAGLRALARRVVEHVLVGGSVAGILFSESFGLGDTGQFLRAVIGWNDDRRLRGHAWLALEGRWRLGSQAHGALVPSTEDEIPAMSISEQMETLWAIHDETITAAEMPDVAPHLILTLSNGRTLFVWGGDCKHLEPWELEYDKGDFQLVCTGWSVSIWTPDDFATDIEPGISL